MKNFRFHVFSGLGTLAALLALTLAPSVSANNSPPATTVKGEDTVGTAPLVQDPLADPGFEVQMPLAQLPLLLQSVSGSGTYRLGAVEDGATLVKVTFYGPTTLRLSKRLLARHDIRVDFRGAPGAGRVLQDRRTLVLVQR